MAFWKVTLAAILIVCHVSAENLEKVNEKDDNSKYYGETELPLPVPPRSNCCGEYEYYVECGGSCDRYCSSLNRPCTVLLPQCPRACYCQDGYARDPYSKICIPIGKCPNIKPTLSPPTSQCY